MIQNIFILFDLPVIAKIQSLCSAILFICNLWPEPPPAPTPSFFLYYFFKGNLPAFLTQILLIKQSFYWLVINCLNFYWLLISWPYPTPNPIQTLMY